MRLVMLVLLMAAALARCEETTVAGLSPAAISSSSAAMEVHVTTTEATPETTVQPTRHTTKPGVTSTMPPLVHNAPTASASAANDTQPKRSAATCTTSSLALVSIVGLLSYRAIF